MSDVDNDDAESLSAQRSQHLIDVGPMMMVSEEQSVHVPPQQQQDEDEGDDEEGTSSQQHFLPLRSQSNDELQGVSYLKCSKMRTAPDE